MYESEFSIETELISLWNRNRLFREKFFKGFTHAVMKIKKSVNVPFKTRQLEIYFNQVWSKSLNTRNTTVQGVNFPFVSFFYYLCPWLIRPWIHRMRKVIFISQSTNWEAGLFQRPSQAHLEAIGHHLSGHHTPEPCSH